MNIFHFYRILPTFNLIKIIIFLKIPPCYLFIYLLRKGLFLMIPKTNLKQNIRFYFHVASLTDKYSIET